MQLGHGRVTLVELVAVWGRYPALPELVLGLHPGDRVSMQACCVAALIRGHLGTSWLCHALRLSVGHPEMQCRFLRVPSMAAANARDR